MQRRNPAPIEPYRFRVDIALRGRRAWIRDERGTVFTIWSFETNPDTGKSWYVLSSCYGFRHVAPENISRIAKAPKEASPK